MSMFLKVFSKFRVWENLSVAEKCVLRFVPCNGMSMVLNYSLIRGAQFSHFDSCALRQILKAKRASKSGVKCYPVSFHLVVGFLFNYRVP